MARKTKTSSSRRPTPKGAPAARARRRSVTEARPRRRSVSELEASTNAARYSAEQTRGGSAGRVHPDTGESSRAVHPQDTARFARPGRKLKTQDELPSDLQSVRVGDERKKLKKKRRKSKLPSPNMRLLKLLIAFLLLIAASLSVYNSGLFTVTQVEVVGARHITAEEMTALAQVPVDTTLLRLDKEPITTRVKENPWVKTVEVKRKFPHTLILDITERTMAAVVSLPSIKRSEQIDWALSDDNVWLQRIPAADSDEGKTLASALFEDASQCIHIEVSDKSVAPVVGAECSDASVHAALHILTGLTTSLKDRVAYLKAPSADSISIVLDNEVEVVFGNDRNIRDKERIALKLMEEHKDTLTSVNVRTVDKPTWH